MDMELEAKDGEVHTRGVIRMLKVLWRFKMLEGVGGI
jgi:hypothetical protein